MILAEIKQYLRQRGQASLAELATHFAAEPEALRGMLEVWQRKGKLVRRQADSACGNCCKCDPAITEIYQWCAE